MSSISSASTDAQVRAAIEDNASYEEDESLSKASAYITAMRVWIGRLSERKNVGDADSRLEVEIEALRKELESAREWRLQNGGGTDAQATQVSLADFGSARE